MGTNRQFNHDCAVELDEKQFNIISDMLKKESKYIQFQLKEYSTYNDFSMLSILTEDIDYIEGLKILDDDDKIIKSSKTYTMYPESYTSGSKLVFNNYGTAIEVNENFLKLLPTLLFDIEYYTHLLN